MANKSPDSPLKKKISGKVKTVSPGKAKPTSKPKLVSPPSPRSKTTKRISPSEKTVKKTKVRLVQELNSLAGSLVDGPSLSPQLVGDMPLKSNTLQINHITKIYSKKKVVNDVSFEVSEGEVVGLLGPNGAGKTTSFYIAVGLIRPDGGKVVFDQIDITRQPMYKRSLLGIGYLPQEPSVFRKLTVRDNVMCILESRNYPKMKRAERTNEILEQLKVTHVANQYGYTLSGGERRRVEIARSLACDPKIILLDEPFAGVDPIAVKDIQTVIRQIQKMNIGILITDHNVRETLKIVSRAYIMSEGKVILKGTAAQLVKSKKAREIYLGDDFQL